MSMLGSELWSLGRAASALPVQSSLQLHHVTFSNQNSPPRKRGNTQTFPHTRSWFMCFSVTHLLCANGYVCSLTGGKASETNRTSRAAHRFKQRLASPSNLQPPVLSGQGDNVTWKELLHVSADESVGHYRQRAAETN